ncbi:MAG: hypothetical protein COV35_06720 [Alphaproteobacteria bacterium CG11_big_fil_rev_8_21_14_0_20_39_49]|nr:MAG: hypothetical protein COV35_06720 [Alphaproteobacteria bacterium CG11_big_fil_rev_8_21_14_0_20_39_49]
MKRDNKCYSSGEMKFMLWGQEIRAYILAPLLNVMKEHGVKPNHITILSLVTGIAAALSINYDYGLTLFMLLLHVLLDGIDGPLARYSKTDSNKGSFADTACDQIVIVAIGLGLIDANLVTPLSGAVYILLYTVVIGFSMVRSAMGIPYKWLIRPRFLLYIWLYFEFYVIDGFTTYILWGFSLILLLNVITGYFKIRRAL